VVSAGVSPISRFSVWGVNLDPARGSEQSGFRPVLVLSPEEINRHLNTVIVAPMTTRLRGWPTRIRVRHDGKTGEVALDQLRTLDRARLANAMGSLNARYHGRILTTLADMFAP
jgi:mRNA interferase MazF